MLKVSPVQPGEMKGFWGIIIICSKRWWTGPGRENKRAEGCAFSAQTVRIPKRTSSRGKNSIAIPTWINKSAISWMHKWILLFHVALASLQCREAWPLLQGVMRMTRRKSYSWKSWSVLFLTLEKGRLRRDSSNSVHWGCQQNRRKETKSSLCPIGFYKANYLHYQQERARLNVKSF